jgi:hypothetical protein
LENLQKSQKASEGILREIQRKRCRILKDRTFKELYPEFCPCNNNYSGAVHVGEIFVRGIYLKITRNSNGVDNMDRMISQICQNNLRQTGRTVDELTCPGALC